MIANIVFIVLGTFLMFLMWGVFKITQDKHNEEYQDKSSKWEDLE